MELELFRAYFPGGTNGIVYLNGLKVCNTIELPWKDNQQSVSCIPEGIYQLAVRHSPKLNWHLHLHDVPGREWIDPSCQLCHRRAKGLHRPSQHAHGPRQGHLFPQRHGAPPGGQCKSVRCRGACFFEHQKTRR